MRALSVGLVCLALALLGGCTTADRGSLSDGLSDLGNSVGSGFGRDTFGTNRRVDVYGGSTAPSLPSIGTPGLGK